MIGHPKADVRRTGAFGAPVDPGVRGWYQDEMTVGIERLLGPTLTVGFKGTYRTLRNVVEDRCDLDFNSPETGYSFCGLMNPGSSGDIASGDIPTCNGLDGDSYECGIGPGPATPVCRPDLPGHRAIRAQVSRRPPLAPGELRLLVSARQLRRRRQPTRHAGLLWSDPARDQRGLRLSPDGPQRVRDPRPRSASPVPPGWLLGYALETFSGPSGVRRGGRAARPAGLLERGLRRVRLSRSARLGGPAADAVGDRSDSCPTRSRSVRRP